MSNFKLIAGVILAMLLQVAIIYWAVDQQSKTTVRIDCTWAEISPDIPLKAKEECRKKLSGRI
jgi:hypothetical protein